MKEKLCSTEIVCPECKSCGIETEYDTKMERFYFNCYNCGQLKMYINLEVLQYAKDLKIDIEKALNKEEFWLLCDLSSIFIQKLRAFPFVQDMAKRIIQRVGSIPDSMYGFWEYV